MRAETKRKDGDPPSGLQGSELPPPLGYNGADPDGVILQSTSFRFARLLINVYAQPSADSLRKGQRTGLAQLQRDIGAIAHFLRGRKTANSDSTDRTAQLRADQ
jgi:hypothetical protein